MRDHNFFEKRLSESFVITLLVKYVDNDHAANDHHHSDDPQAGGVTGGDRCCQRNGFLGDLDFVVSQLGDRGTVPGARLASGRLGGIGRIVVGIVLVMPYSLGNDVIALIHAEIDGECSSDTNFVGTLCNTNQSLLMTIIGSSVTLEGLVDVDTLLQILAPCEATASCRRTLGGWTAQWSLS